MSDKFHKTTTDGYLNAAYHIELGDELNVGEQRLDLLRRQDLAVSGQRCDEAFHQLQQRLLMFVETGQDNESVKDCRSAKGEG
jgi:hypothetical protein